LKTEKNKTRFLQNKTQTLRAEKKELEKQNKELQDQLNNRSQPKPPKRINKKALFLGAGLAIAELTNNYYNPGYSSTSQLSLLNNSINNSLDLNV